MSAIYDFFYNLINQTLPAINESMAIGMASTFTFIMLGLLFAIFPIMIARMLNSKNLVKMYWIVVIVMAMALFFVNNFPNIFHVGDTVITQENSKNYNGYIPLETENLLISLGFEKQSHNLYIISGILQNPILFEDGFYSLNGTYGIDNNECNMCVRTSLLGIDLFTFEETRYIRFIYFEYDAFINQSYLIGSEVFDINIYGISNYEVQP